VLAENDDELVRRTVTALQATGDELVRLSPAWQTAVACRAGYDEVDVLPLRTLLRFARLRPIGRNLAKRLAQLTAVGAWQRVVDARMEDQWELWDVLNLLYAGGYDVTRLWKADPREDDAFCAVIPPEPFRLYSIASAPPPEPARDNTAARGSGPALRLCADAVVLPARTTRNGFALPAQGERRGSAPAVAADRRHAPVPAAG
jgi:sulfite reductase (NADPH) flavoprotein alpha-component